jgi:hypothetical protein
MSEIIRILERKPAPSIVVEDAPALSYDAPVLSYDECLERLARAVAEPDASRLDEVAHLIGQLAVTIE